MATCLKKNVKNVATHTTGTPQYQPWHSKELAVTVFMLEKEEQDAGKFTSKYIPCLFFGRMIAFGSKNIFN